MRVGVMRKASLKRWHLMDQNEGLSTPRSTSVLPVCVCSFKIYFEIGIVQRIPTAPSPKFL